MTDQKRSKSETRLLTRADAAEIADTFGLSGDVRRKVVAWLPILATRRYVRERPGTVTPSQLREKLSLLEKRLSKAELLLRDCLDPLTRYALTPLADHPDEEEQDDIRQRVIDDAQGVSRLRNSTWYALRLLDAAIARHSLASNRARPEDRRFASCVLRLWRETVQGEGASQDGFCRTVLKRAGIAEGSIDALIKRARTHEEVGTTEVLMPSSAEYEAAAMEADEYKALMRAAELAVIDALADDAHEKGIEVPGTEVVQVQW